VPVAVVGNPVDTDFWHPAQARSDQPMGSVVSIGRLEGELSWEFRPDRHSGFLKGLIADS